MNSKSSKIIFIIAESTRVQNVGLYGRTPSPTPNIDKLGGEGVVFNNAYNACTKTDSSFASILSGKYPLSLGFISHGKFTPAYQKENLKDARFLTDILKKQGYKTVAYDWLTRCQHSKTFDYFSGKIRKEVNGVPLHKNNFFLYMQMLDSLSIKFTKRDLFSRFYYSFVPNAKVPGDPEDLLVDKAVNVLEKTKDNNLFLFLHFYAPHFPYIRSKGLKSFMFSSLEDRYVVDLSFLDKQIGRLLNYLRKDEFEDSLIIFTSDHGESLYEHGIPIAHRGVYENVVNIPLIIKHPSLPAKRIDSIVQQIDLLPTILELLGISAPDDIDGKSLIPLINGEKADLRDYAFFEDISYGQLKIKKSSRIRGVRMDNYKYIQTLRGEDEDLFSVFPSKNVVIAKEELYDLKNDSHEYNNLIAKERNVVMQYKSKLETIVSTLENKRNNKC